MKDNAPASETAVIIIGQGRLADEVRKRLSKGCNVIQQADMTDSMPSNVRLALLLQDEWEPNLPLQAGPKLRSCSIPWLAGYIMEQEGAFGPLSAPDAAGCSQCAEYRLLNAGNESEEILSAQASLLVYGKVIRELELRPGGIRQMAWLIAEETSRFLQGKETHLISQLCLVHMETAEYSWHPVLPNPSCEICGEMPEDSQAAGELAFEPSPKVSSNVYRSIPQEELESGLLELYLDERTGVLNRSLNLMLQPFAEVVMNLPSPMGNEAVGGRSHSFKSSAATALLEGLERLSGTSPRGKKTAIVQSYRELSGRAMNPESVGVYSPEQYSDPDFPFEPFDPEAPLPWVWGYSFKQQSPILVPEQLAYYSGGAGFVHEFSNGCALGGSLAEAVFHGILEVAERDSFLMTWYGKLPLQKLDLNLVEDKQLHLMIERMRAVAGYEVHFFDSTMEHGIPSVWAVAKNNKSGEANLLCSAGAHPDIIRAVKSALFELGGAIPRIEAGYRERLPHIKELFHHSNKVEEMEDHALLYSLQEAEARLSFLLDQKENTSIRMIDKSYRPTEIYEDMVDEMQSVVEKILEQGLDVIVVDQTSPEITVKGLHCVKVLIPGMLPMTFGHSLIRLNGLERVFQVPQKLGYKADKLTPGELNPYPHPFL